MRRTFAILAALMLLGSAAVLTANAAYPLQDKASSQPTGGISGAQPSGISTQSQRIASTSRSLKSDTSPILRNIPPVPARKVQPDNDNYTLPGHGKGADVQDSVRQSVVGPLAIPAPIISFDGMYNQYGPIPPDTNGDVGRTQYVQLVNSGIQVFNKTTGASVFGPVNLNTVWYRFGGFCETYNNGDPVVLYDSLADRWMLSQFAFASQSGPTHQCIAISTSPDAAGSYYRYDFVSTTQGFDDYPHYGVMPDAYYMTANRFNGPSGPFAGANIAYERPRMLVGDPTARLVQFEVVGDGGALPADFDGLTPPPAGSPEYFWYPTLPAAGLINEYKFHVDFNTPALSTFLGPFPITVAPWNDTICGASRGACIPQPGTTAQLETVSDRFMHRLAYRNFGSYEALTVAQTVNATGGTPGIAGVRWYEVRDPNGARTVFQQGTYAPADGVYRWMGSASMDRMGDLAIGFSASSSTLFPSLRYAGRLVSDPLGQLSQGEATLHPGTGSEDFPAAPRWGDYSALTVDPVDDCTFYYTTEYFAQTGLRNWRTRIGSFRFPSCTGATATPAASSTPGPSLTPLPPTATACPGGSSSAGTITNTDTVQAGRLGVGSPPSSCAAPRPSPAVSDTLARHVDQYSYTNSTGSSQCVTVYVTQACGDNAAQSVAYLNTYDPNNIQTNYLAHGGAAGPSYQYSFTLPAGQTAKVVMVEVSPNLGCANYNVAISPCASGGTTPTVTPTSTVTAITTPSATTISTGTATTISTGTATVTAAASTTGVTSVTATSVPSTTATVCNISFSDVAPGSAFYTFIKCLACRGVISGYGDGTFRPSGSISRGQITKMVSNAAGFNEDPGAQIYSDVPPGSTFYPFINRLTRRGVVAGYPCPTRPGADPCTPENPALFRPGANATRGQMAKIVSNSAGFSETVSGQFYADVPAGSQFYTWIMRLTNRNVMSGYACGGSGEPCDAQRRPYFRPGNEVSRGQSSKIVANTFFPNCQPSAHP